MSYKSTIKVKEDIDLLRNKFKQAKESYVSQRIRSLIILKEYPTKKQADIAVELCVSHSTLKRWYKKYREDGLEKFIQLPSIGGSKSNIPANIHLALEKKLQDSENPLLGYWQAVEWVKNEFGFDIKYHTLRHHLITHFKTKMKSPRKSHYQKDEQAIEAFLKTT